MDIIKITTIALITLFLTLTTREIKPEISVFISLAGGIIITTIAIGKLSNILSEFYAVINALNIDSDIIKILIKIIFIGYLTEFSSSLCRDTQNSSLADKIVFAGKIIIFSISIPIFKNILDIILGLL